MPTWTTTPADEPTRWRYYVTAWALGLCAFLGGPVAISVRVEGVHVTFDWALGLAVLGAMAYGVRPALVGALLGLAAFTPFNAWPNNGLANLGGSFCVLVWLVGHAAGAERHARAPRLMTHPLVLQVPLGLLYSSMLYWGYPTLLSLNEAAGCTDCITEMSPDLRFALGVKAFLVLYTQTTAASSLLLVNSVRHMLGVPTRDHGKGNGRILAVAVLSGLTLWLADLGLSAVFGGELLASRLAAPFQGRDEVMTLIVLVTGSLLAAQGLIALMERVRRHALELSAQVDAINASEESLQRVVDGVNEAILVLDPESCTLLRDNLQARRIFGAEPQALVWNALGGFAPRGRGEHDPKALCAELRATAAARDPSRAYTARTAGGDTFSALASVHETRIRGRRVFVCTVRDITAQRRVEEELAHARKLDAIGRLAGGVAHDFNNLLSAMMSATSTLSLDLADQPRHRESLDALRNAGERAKELTQKLLDFARKGSGIDLPFDVHDAVASAAALLSRTLPKDIALVVATRARHTMVRGDTGQLQGALLNLGTNAMHAMPKGGELHIETEDGLSEANERFVTIRVRDTGQGIPPEQVEHIFEPFFTTKAPGSGTGLGLASVYAAVTRARGVITVTSELGAGTQFDMRLPITEDAALPRVEEPAGDQAAAAGLVLVVDDDDLVRTTSITLLERLGYRVLEAADGASAEELYRRHAAEIDVVVLDAIMPGLSGRECFTRLKAIRPDVRVVLCSGYTVESEATALRREGVRVTLQKPFRVQALRAAIEEARAPDVIAMEPEE